MFIISFPGAQGCSHCTNLTAPDLYSSRLGRALDTQQVAPCRQSAWLSPLASSQLVIPPSCWQSVIPPCACWHVPMNISSTLHVAPLLLSASSPCPSAWGESSCARYRTVLHPHQGLLLALLSTLLLLLYIFLKKVPLILILHHFMCFFKTLFSV